MRSVVHGAVASARELLTNAVGKVIEQSGPSEDEQLAQYMQLRGDPAALSAFVQQHRALWSGPDANPLAEQARYERTMEEKLRERGFVPTEQEQKQDTAAFTAGLPKGW